MVLRRDLEQRRESRGVSLHAMSYLFRNVLVDQQDCDILALRGELVESRFDCAGLGLGVDDKEVLTGLGGGGNVLVCMLGLGKKEICGKGGIVGGKKWKTYAYAREEHASDRVLRLISCYHDIPIDEVWRTSSPITARNCLSLYCAVEAAMLCCCAAGRRREAQACSRGRWRAPKFRRHGASHAKAALGSGHNNRRSSLSLPFILSSDTTTRSPCRESRYTTQQLLIHRRPHHTPSTPQTCPASSAAHLSLSA
jgi:hypothetical protein